MVTGFGRIARGYDYAAQQTAADARSKATDARAKVSELEARLDRTLLLCEALWTLVSERMGISDDDLVDRVNQIDLSDGELDGKVRRPAVACPKCNRTIARRFKSCMYCGQPIMHDPFA